jgi:Putative auto-transporter adhesin, head GIN domain
MYNIFLLAVMSVFGLNHSKVPDRDTAFTYVIIPVESSFESINIYDDITVFIIEGAQNQIIVKDDEAASKIKFKVKEETLDIRIRNSLLGCKSVKLTIMVKNINDITIIGNSKVKTIGDLSYRHLTLEMYGNGSLLVNTKAVEVNTFIQGLGKIEVRGNFKHTS